MKIINITIEEMNEFVNINKSSNGGGYSQPTYTITFDNKWKLIVSDNCCGEFGTRYGATLCSPSGKPFASATWGTMEQCEYSSFLLEDYSMILRAIENANISLPWFDASLCVEYRLPTYKVWHKPAINLTRDPHIWDAPQMCHLPIGDAIIARDPSTKFDKIQSITFGQHANEIFSEVNLINHIREMFNFTIEDFDIDFDN